MKRILLSLVSFEKSMKKMNKFIKKINKAYGAEG